jgi:hypothetical protein
MDWIRVKRVLLVLAAGGMVFQVASCSTLLASAVSNITGAYVAQVIYALIAGL